VMEQSLVFLAAAAKGRARRAKSLGAGAAVHVVGPAEGWQSLSIPSNMKEPEAHGRMTGVFPSPAVAAFPGKSSGKRMARGSRRLVWMVLHNIVLLHPIYWLMHLTRVEQCLLLSCVFLLPHFATNKEKRLVQICPIHN
jgi:hypothetical protein